jgi:hypothetical protein
MERKQKYRGLENKGRKITLSWEKGDNQNKEPVVVVASPASGREMETDQSGQAFKPGLAGPIIEVVG